MITIRITKLQRAGMIITGVGRRLSGYSCDIAKIADEMDGLDESFCEVVHTLNKTCTALAEKAGSTTSIHKALEEIRTLYEQAERNICTFEAFNSIPDDKKYEIESDLLKKVVIDDTNHKIEIIDPLYFKEHLQDKVDEISLESVIKDLLEALHKTATNDPGADEARIDFTLNSQILAEKELMMLLAGYAFEKYDLPEGSDDAMDSLDLFTTEYLAYGVLIDGVPMIEYFKQHPEEVVDKTAPIYQRDKNRAAKEAKNKKKAA